MRKLVFDRAGIDCEITVIRTSGDRIQDRPLADAGGKGLFTKELEQALLANEIDLAVHSMKDVPVAMPDGLTLAALLPREDPRDAFLSTLAGSLDTLPRGARIGTSSVRRQAQIARARPDLKITLLRGNIDTRLAKCDAGEYDAIILAYAGLKRLGFEDRVTALLPAESWLPALAQGAIGIETRSEDQPTNEAVALLNDSATEIALSCERAFQSALDGSCRTPIAGLATWSDNVLRFHGEVLAPDGQDHVETKFETRMGERTCVEEAYKLGLDAGLHVRPRAVHWLAL